LIFLGLARRERQRAVVDWFVTDDPLAELTDDVQAAARR